MKWNREVWVEIGVKFERYENCRIWSNLAQQRVSGTGERIASTRRWASRRVEVQLIVEEFIQKDFKDRKILRRLWSKLIELIARLCFKQFCYITETVRIRRLLRFHFRSLLSRPATQIACSSLKFFKLHTSPLPLRWLCLIRRLASTFQYPIWCLHQLASQFNSIGNQSNVRPRICADHRKSQPWLPAVGVLADRAGLVVAVLVLAVLLAVNHSPRKWLAAKFGFVSADRSPTGCFCLHGHLLLFVCISEILYIGCVVCLCAVA